MTKAKTKKPDWNVIRVEFETSDVKMAVLSRKHGVPYPTLRDRSRRESWGRDRDENRKELVKKTSQKVIETIASAHAYDITKELEASNLINDLILRTMQDSKQFNRHLVQVKNKTITPDFNVEETQSVEEREFVVVDAKRLQAMASALKVSSELKRLLLNIVDQDKVAKLEIEQGKLDVDKRRLANDEYKSGIDDAEDGLQSGIMLMPSVDLETYQTEKDAELERLIAEKKAKEEGGVVE